MRKIEQILINLIREKQSIYINERDEMKYDDNEEKLTVLLHSNAVATICYKSNTVVFSDCGYSTQTTASRLNAAAAAIGLPVTFRIKNDCTTVYVCGKKTDATAFTVNGWTVKISA